MKRAVLSDIHGNLESLQAVLGDIDEQGITEIYCLGDIVGYGPNPCECIDLAMLWDVCVLGNHDQAALCAPESFGLGAEQAIYWTRRQLNESPAGPDQKARRWDFLNEMPRCHRDSGMLFVHGSARDPLTEYVFPEDVYNVPKIENLFALIHDCCFQGHTHVPGIFTHGGDFLNPAQFELGNTKTMINPGSVGQPRDGDWRACYVVLCDRSVSFRRVEYPLEGTIEKIHAVAELDNFLGDRLREGR